MIIELVELFEIFKFNMFSSNNFNYNDFHVTWLIRLKEGKKIQSDGYDGIIVC